VAVVGALALTALACSLGGDGGDGGATSGPTDTPGPRVLFRDDFSSDSSGWGTGSDDTGSLFYEAGEYVFRITQDRWFTWGNLEDETFENVRIEVDITDRSSTDEPSFGIMCNYQDTENYYYAGFASDGFYAIVRTEGNEDFFLTDPVDNQWIQSDDIATGAGSYSISLECANGQLRLTADGDTIATVQDDTFTSGQIGLFVLTFDEPTAEVYFDNLRVIEVE
jgi:hypothetical protein